MLATLTGSEVSVIEGNACKLRHWAASYKGAAQAPQNGFVEFCVGTADSRVEVGAQLLTSGSPMLHG